LKVFKRIISSSQLRQLTKKKLGLNLKIYSFSYKNGIPQDYSGHNGGFVFDCRCLPNPGREERYRDLTGRDGEVMEFLEKNTEVDNFFKNASSLVDQAVNNYLDRNFTDLSVSFGCTGGRHRSVYMAEKLARNFKLKKGVSVILKHMEIGKK
jgi:RNase adaptor protein for sRNA GlmZ degradation